MIYDRIVELSCSNIFQHNLRKIFFSQEWIGPMEQLFLNVSVLRDPVLMSASFDIENSPPGSEKKRADEILDGPLVEFDGLLMLITFYPFCFTSTELLLSSGCWWFNHCFCSSTGVLFVFVLFRLSLVGTLIDNWSKLFGGFQSWDDLSADELMKQPIDGQYR